MEGLPAFEELVAGDDVPAEGELDGEGIGVDALIFAVRPAGGNLAISAARLVAIELVADGGLGEEIMGSGLTGKVAGFAEGGGSVEIPVATEIFEADGEVVGGGAIDAAPLVEVGVFEEGLNGGVAVGGGGGGGAIDGDGGGDACDVALLASGGALGGGLGDEAELILQNRERANGDVDAVVGEAEGVERPAISRATGGGGGAALAGEKGIAEGGAIDGEEATVEDVASELFLAEVESGEDAELIGEGIIADEIAAENAWGEVIGDAEVWGELAGAEGDELVRILEEKGGGEDAFGLEPRVFALSWGGDLVEGEVAINDEAWGEAEDGGEIGSIDEAGGVT